MSPSDSLYSLSDRLQKLPPYLFAKIDQIKSQELAQGRKLISLSIGDPDLPTPDFVINRLMAASKRASNHQYPSYWGMKEFRETASRFYSRRFGVSVNPENEVIALIGSKEGIGHMPLAFVNPGDGVLCPDPGYPVYNAGTVFAGGTPLFFPLKPEKKFLPDFDDLDRLVASHPRVKLLWINYPNNPTAACASVDDFEAIAQWAKARKIIVCHDNAYSEIYFDGKRQPSFLQAPTAKEVGVEFNSLSKTFNMTGWRIGMCVGNAKIVEGLSRVKTNLDSGTFNAVQEAGIAALEEGDAFCENLRSIYQKRRDILIEALKAANIQCQIPQATIYVWCKVPGNQKSEDFVMNLIQTKGIIGTPGNGFGSQGEGFVRFTLCADEKILKQVAQALAPSV